ncbi:hypothetical protein A1O1_07313 [Capronia coronata CBS 617.96]|uniref:Uncharacterized protein n=1 Tax=Capronia coronata CBS 617.96 TaxID=1182541 RepID=W9YN45_9EURO|nr:uncharacterized protein A1O1_07313 [Capronia coronata CBS 617.96]EXJ83689.1 hypothetical protein A1O1_07313 [Capronia coronata CBS 617.96]
MDAGLVDKSSEQAASPLQAELQGTIRSALGNGRPILTHLNADTTWLLSLAYPDDTSPPAGRLRYNILIDPWLDGPQEDLAGWFSRQWHVVKSSVQTISELEDLLHDMEAIYFQSTRLGSHSEEPGTQWTGSFIDAVAVSHEFTDHCHKATLTQLDPNVPVFATQKAARLIQGWHYFDAVLEMTTLTKGVDWRKTSLAPLPDWVGIGRLITECDSLHLHSAVVICVRQRQSPIDAAETVVYSPHGVEASTLSVFDGASPPLTALAFLHGLHDVSLAWSKQLNLGALNAVRAQKLLRAKYWVATHDEEKLGSGLIAPLLRRKVVTVAEAVQSLRAGPDKNVYGSEHWAEGLECVELRNGESILLE